MSVLATSRAPLRLRAEREFPLRELDADAAASLFRERASAVLPTFEADPSCWPTSCGGWRGFRLQLSSPRRG